MADTRTPTRFGVVLWAALVLAGCQFDRSGLDELTEDPAVVEPDATDGANLDLPDTPVADTGVDFSFDLRDGSEDEPDLVDSSDAPDSADDPIDADLVADAFDTSDEVLDLPVESDLCPPIECTVGVGVCEVPGVWTCADGGEFCDGTPGDPQGPACDDEDDDCDDEVDEGVVAQTTSLEILTPTPPNRAVQSSEAVVVDGTVYAYLRYTAPGQQLGQLVAFNEDGGGLALAAQTHLCLANPQLAVSNGIIITSCDTNLSGPILNVFTTGLTFVTSIALDEPNDGQIRQVHHIDLHLWAPVVGGDPADLPIDSVALMTYMSVLSSNSRVVVRRITPDPLAALSYLEERVEFDHASAPASVFVPREQGEDPSLVIVGHYDFTEDEVVVRGLDSTTLEPPEDAGLDIEFRTGIAGLRCDLVHRMDAARSGESVDALFAFSATRGGENCDGLTASNTQILYRADLNGLVEVDTRSGTASRVAGDPLSGDGAWLVLEAGEGQFAFVAGDETLQREASLPDVVPFDDLVSTTAYFGVLAAADRFLRWDQIGCD